MRFGIMLDHSMVRNTLDFFIGADTIPVIAPYSPLGKWIDDHNIKYELKDCNLAGRYDIDLDIDADVAVEFILCWGDILCQD